ncbi:MAG: YczE/YyaS/YitT family protein [Christensenellaceae bacterium]|jgi:uncharacterized membrane protein YczE
MKRRVINCVLCYLFGILLIAVGVNVSINSNLGVSPVNSFPVSVSNVTGFDRGWCVTIIFLAYVGIQALILRSAFKLKDLLQIVFSTIFGYFVTFTGSLLGDFIIPTYFGRLAMLALSIIFIALGLVFYLTADIVPMPMEGMAMAIAEKSKKPFHQIKTILDCTSVALAVLISVIGFGFKKGLLEGVVREGTVLSALVIGKVMSLFAKPLQPIIKKWCFAEEKQQ